MADPPSGTLRRGGCCFGLGFRTVAEATGTRSNNAIDVSHHFRLMILIKTTPSK
jgi:hypothetical protein